MRHHFLQLFSMAERNTIPFHVQIDLPAQISVDETDFCLVLSNLLENALEASLKTAKFRQRIDIKIYRHASNLICFYWIFSHILFTHISLRISFYVYFFRDSHFWSIHFTSPSNRICKCTPPDLWLIFSTIPCPNFGCVTASPSLYCTTSSFLFCAVFSCW